MQQLKHELNFTNQYEKSQKHNIEEKIAKGWCIITLI